VSAAQPVTARLLIFSGRADPEWSFEGEALATLVRLIRDSVGREPAYPPTPGGLGYRGFLVRGDERELPRELLVFRGALTENPGPRARHWRDTNGLEAWLISDARRRDHGQVLDAAGAPQTPPDASAAPG
jgi:hypothetical protein